jgi:hypothetical protein
MPDKKKEIELLSNYIDAERKDLLTIESAIQSSEETLRVLSRRHQEIREKLSILEEILETINSAY